MSNSIHPTAIISGDVHLGTGNTIGPYALLTGPLTVGDDNWIGAGVILGAPPEVRSFAHPRVATDGWGEGIVMGNNNVIREYAQIHHGWHRQTTIHDDTFIMNQAYIAHDCNIGTGVTLASSVLLAGTVTLGEGVNIGLTASVHQRVTIGAAAMVGMGSVVRHDIPPLAKSFGNPARIRGANTIGMERRGLSEAAIEAARDAYSQENPGAGWSVLAEIEELASFFTEWAKLP
ncbi:MAG TPA: acyl-ACP--UDP-N- acetylglucosamine O-acyltransferase [Pseudolysinimonas sp.]|nr:acyl-ACP--UDP-N- acetylglucosamine O-acyltransferase [Pseudolysinimonas sp.]